MEINNSNIKKILSNFRVQGDLIDFVPFGNGHINDTYLAHYKESDQNGKYILRKLNSLVFKKPMLVIENAINVSNHIKQKLIKESEPELNRKVMTFLKTNHENYYHRDGEGNFWCLVLFINGAHTIERVEFKEQAFEAAKSYGLFQKYLLDFDILKCHETIEDFHNLNSRNSAYLKSIKSDVQNRVSTISDEISLVEKFSYITKEFAKLQNSNLPTRIIHNDTKINNVMLDTKTNRGLCVIDLDTVMPGTVLNDFGDMVRSFTNTALEDEQDLSKVEMSLPIFESLVVGYLSELKGKLTKVETSNLVPGIKIIVFEQAIRFLTDYIDGDIYYKTRYDTHNLMRAKNQLALLKSIELQSDAMQEVVKNYSEIK